MTSSSARKRVGFILETLVLGIIGLLSALPSSYVLEIDRMH